VSGIIGIKSWIGDHEIAIPSRLFKVILALPLGDNDIERIKAGLAQIISIEVPNDSSVKGKTWSYYTVPMSKIEAESGLDFFSNINSRVMTKIEGSL
jgi:endonuclease G